MPTVIYSLQEFAEQQRCAYVYYDGVYLFENGAWSNGQDHHQPPTDPMELLHIQLDYAQAMKEDAKRKHAAIHDAVRQQLEFFQANAGPNPDDHLPEWRQQLAHWKAQIEKWTVTAFRLKQHLPVDQRARVVADQKAARQAQARDIRHELDELQPANL